MNSESKKIINLLNKNDFFDNVFMNIHTDMSIEIKHIKNAEEIEIPDVDWIYKTTNHNIYFIGIGNNGLVAASADAFDYWLHNKEEIYLVPFFLFAREFLENNHLNNLELDDFLFHLKKAKSIKIYNYALDMIEYIKWYEEQGYPLYEYIPKLELFLKEQVEIWRDKFESIKNE